MYILGAGLSGCIAAILNPQAIILEASEQPPTNHNAVLRFRSDKISKVTGIPFKKVNVQKSIYVDGQHYSHVSPLHANLYSQKVTGKILPRSILNLNTVERYIAPADLHRILLERIGDRVEYGNDIVQIDERNINTSTRCIYRADAGADPSIISTVPMTVMSRIANMKVCPPLGPFEYKPIYTARYLVEGCDVNQTIYFPESEVSLYRATLTGDNLILEGSSGIDGGSNGIDDCDGHYACKAFGIPYRRMELISEGKQKFGKIAPVPDGSRKEFMFNLTRELNIYSLGRFAVWKNILLDDVYEDVFAIRRMIEQSHYDIRKEMSK